MDQSLWSSVLPYVGEIYSYLQNVQMQILKDQYPGILANTEPNLIHALQSAMQTWGHSPENLSSYIKSEAILEKSKAHFRWLTILVSSNPQ